MRKRLRNEADRTECGACAMNVVGRGSIIEVRPLEVGSSENIDPQLLLLYR